VVNDRLETELKIPVTDLNTVREALVRHAATQIHPLAREANILLDADDGRLRESGSILRLRTYGEKHILTFKGPVKYLGKIKQRPEYEISCDDTGRMAEIFKQLGYSSVARYEKYREAWLFDGVEVVLDHTPMGDFVEIEGPLETLDTTAVSLGLDPEMAVRGSYLSLWSEYRTRRDDEDLPDDMVFPE
jgi:adenylate cyclase class 2